jgi:6,7-dimethyl-8-ribityllumazine synthase
LPLRRSRGVTEGDRWPAAPELTEPPLEQLEEDAAVEDGRVEDEAAEEIVAAANLEESEHAAGEFSVPEGYGVLEGTPHGDRRSVGVVVSRFNGAVTSKLLEGALAELDEAGVGREAITVMPVPGAFELPIAAMALAKTRRYACIVALGCVIRGDTPHFDYVAGEAASGLQLAALETGVPVAFGVLTLEEADQADDRLEKGAEAVRTGLEMADVFAQLRAAAQR